MAQSKDLLKCIDCSAWFEPWQKDNSLTYEHLRCNKCKLYLFPLKKIKGTVTGRWIGNGET